MSSFCPEHTFLNKIGKFSFQRYETWRRGLGPRISGKCPGFFPACPGMSEKRKMSKNLVNPSDHPNYVVLR